MARESQISPNRRRNGLALCVVGFVGVVIALYTKDFPAGMCAIACLAIGYLVLAKTAIGFVAFDWIVIYSILVALLGSTFWVSVGLYNMVGNEMPVPFAFRNLLAYLLFLCICIFGLHSTVSVRSDSMQFSLFEMLVSISFCSLVFFRFSNEAPASNWKEFETHTYVTIDELVTVHIGLQKNGSLDFLVIATCAQAGHSALTTVTQYQRESTRTRFQIQMDGESIDPKGTNSCFVIHGYQVTRTSLNLTYAEIIRLIENKTRPSLFIESSKSEDSQSKKD